MKTGLNAGVQHKFLGEQNSLQRLLIYFVFFMIIGFILFYIARTIAYIGFDTMDDIQIQNLLNGSKGVSDGFCNHMNVALGSSIAFLYRALPAINWYGVFLISMLLISCSLAAAVLAQRLGGKIGIAIGFTVFSFIFLDTLYNFTYTIIAYVILTSAFLCIVYAFFQKDKSKRLFLWIIAAVLTVLAVMLREDIITSAAAVGVVFVLFLLIGYKKAAIKATVLVAAILILSFGLTIISNLLFQSDPVWSQYYSFNETRIDMQDHSYPAYNQNKVDFQKYGWSENDYNLFYSANIPDDPKFSIENMEQIDATYKNFTRLKWNTSDILASLWDYLSHSVLFVTLLVTAFVLAFKSSKARLLCVALFAFPFLMQLVLVVMQRPLERVVIPNYYISLCILLCLIDVSVLREWFGNKLGKEKSRKFAIIALILALSISVYPVYLTYNYCFQLEEQRRNPHVAGDYNNQMRLFDYFAHHKDNFYVYSMELTFYSYSQNLSIFETKPKNYYINSFSLGGWAVRSKQYESFKTLAGVSSLPRDIIDNDNIYFATIERMSLYTTYFYETYGIPVKYEIADEISGFPIYRVKTATSLSEMGTIYKGY